ncbi:hypothetical protein F5Y16DRAFT_398851 [Xylariaceae sp. FL0255]|nr:hypothetical protein F5Y16DRAFT_398851 [Xylariaceae sp. FL0255]
MPSNSTQSAVPAGRISATKRDYDYTNGTYEYVPLADEEICLINILPGSWDDPILLEIFHAPLPQISVPDHIAPSFHDVPSIRKSLPPDWDAFETTDGDIVYNNGDYVTSYHHPGPLLIPSSKQPDEPYHTEWAIYEALSYC